MFSVHKLFTVRRRGYAPPHPIPGDLALHVTARNTLVFVCLLLAAAKVSAQGEPMEKTESLRYDFFSAALSCPITRGMGTVGGRFFENGKIVTYPFKPYH